MISFGTALSCDRRLQELEAELDKDQPLSSVETPLWQPLERYINRSQVEAIRNRVVNWFNLIAGKSPHFAMLCS